LELAWLEVEFVDEGQNRRARSRICMARSAGVHRVVIQALITMDFWVDQVERFAPVWDEVLRSLTLGDFVDDPTRRLLH
jgi:hypothetical protein